MAEQSESMLLRSSFDPFLQDKGKGRAGSGGNYRSNVEPQLERFEAWAAGDQGPANWDGITPEYTDRRPTFADLDERVFRKYARHLAGDRDLKQNTVQTYYAYISGWLGWCVNEGYVDAHYARRAQAKEPLPDDDGRKSGDQQHWSPEQRHALTSFVDEQARDAIDGYHPADIDDDVERQRARYAVLQKARDRALVYLVAYTAVRIGELLRDPDDPRRRGVRWGELNLEDGSMQVYRKKQSWDDAALPKPVITPLRTYRKLLEPPSERWPVFPTLHHRTLAELVCDKLADRGLKPAAIDQRRDECARDLFVALAEDLEPPSLTTNGARNILKRLTEAADIDIEHQRHDYLSPHGGRRGMGEVLVRAFGYTTAARYLDNSEEMIRERYSQIEAGELGVTATEAIQEVDENAGTGHPESATRR